MNATEIIVLVLKLSIFLIVLGLGLTATLRDVTRLSHSPWSLFKALLSLTVILPVVAILLVVVFDLNPAVKVALVALSLSPVPPILPKRQLEAGGREDFVIGLLVTTALLSIIFIPTALEIIERIVGVPLQMSFIGVAKVILTTILVPLGIGIAIRAFAVSFADKVARPLMLAGTLLLVVAAVPLLFGLRRALLSLIGDGTLLAMGVFGLVALMSGHLLGGPKPENRTSLALATAGRHPGAAFAIAHTNFPQQQSAIAAIALWLIVFLLISTLYVLWMKRRQAVPANVGEHSVKA